MLIHILWNVGYVEVGVIVIRELLELGIKGLLEKTESQHDTVVPPYLP